jgi:hypothetical protein
MNAPHAAVIEAGPEARSTEHDGPLGLLEPIGLEELVSRAALLHRVDRKYIVQRSLLPGLYAAAGGDAGAMALEIAGRRDAAYASVYFDTERRELYLAAAHKRRRRAKVRTRSYLDSGLSYLEVKTRGPRGATVKRRTEHPLDAGAVLGPAALGYVEPELAAAGLPADLPGRLVPLLTSHYSRSTLYLPADGARVTVDTGLRWGLLAPGGEPVPGGSRVFSEQAIVETKSSSTPSAVDRWLWQHGHRPAQISKFATGLAVLEPGLPHNKWHRTLNRHYADAV